MLATKNKFGVSIMIGYVLLVTFALIMGFIAYQWLKTYVPQDALECPDGVSVIMKDVNLDCSMAPDEYILNFTLLNNGRFNISGYFIKATNDLDQPLATIDKSSDITKGGRIHKNAIIYDAFDENSLGPNGKRESIFTINEQIYTIEILPVRFQIEKENRERLISCSEAEIKEVLNSCP